MLQHKQVFRNCDLFLVEIPHISIQFIVDIRVLKITSTKMFVVRDSNPLG